MISSDIQFAAETCAQIAALSAKYGALPTEQTETKRGGMGRIVLALEQFMECVRYLNTRRSGTTLALDSEAAVQDAMFLMLRPWIPDLVPESPSDRIASRYTIKDFRSVTAKAIIEAKYVRDKDHGRSISKELHDDIETYRSDSHCEHIIFFVYDPDVFIPDRAALKKQIEVVRQYDGRELLCSITICP